jgi:hypothetical protein
LTGPSLDALSGVELGESEVAADGTWRARRVPRRAVSAGIVTVKLASSSAALISVSPRASASG